MPETPTPGSLGHWWTAWTERDKSLGSVADEIPRTLAQNYVDAHRAELEGKYGHLTQEQCVDMVGVYKRSGDQGLLLEVKCWIMSEYPPQNIGGVAKIVRRGQRGQ